MVLEYAVGLSRLTVLNVGWLFERGYLDQCEAIFDEVLIRDTDPGLEPLLRL